LFFGIFLAEADTFLGGGTINKALRDPQPKTPPPKTAQDLHLTEKKAKKFWARKMKEKFPEIGRVVI